MGLSGRRIETFEEANRATATGVSTNGPYVHLMFDLIEQEGDVVTLKSHWDGSTFEREIEGETHGYEYVTIEQTPELHKMFYGDESEDITVIPFKGSRI